MLRFDISVQLILVSVVTTITATTAFPGDQKPCLYGDTECIKNFINFLLQEKSQGYPPLNIANLNPLKMPEIAIKQGKGSSFSIDLKFKNPELFGLKDSKVTRVKGFGKDLTQPHEIYLASKSLSFVSDYAINGNVLVLPISGSGKSNTTMENAKLKLIIFGEPLVKDGKTYMHVKKAKFDMDTTRLHFDFENLFGGDKAVGDNLNTFLNENWKDIFAEARKSLNAFAFVYEKQLNSIFEILPYDELFAHDT